MLRTAYHELSNGLPIVLIDLPHVHAVSAALLVRSGPRFESAAENGLSHLVEHLLFRGTAAHPSSLHFHTAVEAMGGEINGLTHRDATTVHITVPPNHATGGLRLLGEVCVTPLLQGLDVERDVVIEEILDTCDASGVDLDIDTLSRRILWDGHPMSMPVAGEVDLVEKFDSGQCRRRFQETFVAKNAVLVIAGPLDHDGILVAAREAFGAMPSGAPLREPAPPIPQPMLPIHVQPTDDSQVSVLLTFPAPPEDHPDFAAQLLLRRILDDGFGSRLRQAICEQRGLAYSLGVSLDTYRDAGAFDLELQCAPEKLVRSVERMLITLRELLAETVSEGELHRAKTRHIAELEFSLDCPGELCTWYGGATLLGTKVDYRARRAQIENVTAADILRLAHHLFDWSRALLTLVGPVEDDQARRLELLLHRPHTSTVWYEAEDELGDPVAA